MSVEDRRRVSAEMMARIDAVVSGHELQRSSEAAPRYIPRVDDGPLRFDEETPRDAYEARARSLHADLIEAFPDRFHDDDADGSEATTAFFEGVNRARSRLGYPPDEGEVVEFEATGPLTVTLPLGLPPGVTIHATILDTTPFPDNPAPETRTPFREAYEALQTAWTDLRLALLDRLGR